METRERRPEQRPIPTASHPGAAGPAGQDLQAAGQRFLQAGTDAINRALAKGNSEAFLAAHQQEGGQ